ncbi:MAG: methylated-DNA--[protein]-cysteine S-methyltransferase [Armatimonadetes bacterium]|nr:methylated-DNA--[protein]-cysteine S-methyltransferase [Armatimonadota bacterium]
MKEEMLELARYIEANCDQALTLEALAERAGYSPFHLQRLFKSSIGVSPKEYLESCRLRRLRTGLQDQQSVSLAIVEAGFGSSSRVYEKLDTRLGMTPKQYREKGRGLAISYATTSTQLGLVMMGATDRGICFIQFGAWEQDLRGQLEREYPAATLTPMAETHRDQFELWMRALSDYLAGDLRSLDLPLDVRGTAFQLKVWKYLQTIPAGQVASYAEVAEGIGNPKAARAVASACAKNTIAIAIPCHRVIRGNGDMAGYRWGKDRKRTLLDLERKVG